MGEEGAAVPLKQVMKFFILESSRKSCRQEGQAVTHESQLEGLPNSVRSGLAWARAYVRFLCSSVHIVYREARSR